jgi:hypothetical protein
MITPTFTFFDSNGKPFKYASPTWDLYNIMSQKRLYENNLPYELWIEYKTYQCKKVIKNNKGEWIYEDGL